MHQVERDCGLLYGKAIFLLMFNGIVVVICCCWFSVSAICGIQMIFVCFRIKNDHYYSCSPHFKRASVSKWLTHSFRWIYRVFMENNVSFMSLSTPFHYLFIRLLDVLVLNWDFYFKIDFLLQRGIPALKWLFHSLRNGFATLKLKNVAPWAKLVNKNFLYFNQTKILGKKSRAVSCLPFSRYSLRLLRFESRSLKSQLWKISLHRFYSVEFFGFICVFFFKRKH